MKVIFTASWLCGLRLKPKLLSFSDTPLPDMAAISTASSLYEKNIQN